MRVLRHTIGCRVTGYESLQITLDLGLTSEQIALGQDRSEHIFVLDFPNWDEVVEALEMFTIDPATGLSTTTPMPKPTIPLTAAGLGRLPTVLVRYIGGIYVVWDANNDYMRTVRPFLETD